jgi:pyrimidine-nucleoside phosphorylase
MRPTDIIMKKRGTFIRSSDGKQTLTSSTSLTQEEIKYFIDGYVSGTIPDYQVSSWLMAVYFNGMTFEETGWLTDTMLHSGDVIDLHGYEKEGLTGPFVDKHSTGGVGDKISLPLAPIVACCGIQVPMMSGRALGHTGGTLDKLESIEGYKVGLTPDTFRKFIAKTGFAMTGQTKEIVPADRLLYALRDVTGTVESVPLITASILSKKVAEGADALVFDVKYGSGAFMKSIPDAEMLASFLVKTAGAMGKKAAALITNMDTPLGWKIGNFLEIEETLECLQGHGPEDVMAETYALGAEMLMLGGKAVTKEEGIEKCKAAVNSGKALEKFLENVRDQGGNPEKLLAEQGKRRSTFHITFKAKQDGYITLDAYQTGLAGVDLGVGRSKTTDPVCADAGFILHAKTGSFVRAGDAVMEVYGKNSSSLDSACARLEKAVDYSTEKPEEKPLIYKEIHQ